MRNACISFFATALTLSALSGAGLAQEAQLKNNSAYPLQIVSVSPRLSNDATTFEGAEVRVQNKGSIPCAAFAVSLVLELSNSQTRKVSLREDHVALGYTKPNSSADEIAPEQIYTMQNPGGVRVTTPRDATITGIEARIDYVEMAGGKTYGEDPDKVGEMFRMARWGHAAEHERLLKILNTQGVQALLNEVQRP